MKELLRKIVFIHESGEFHDTLCAELTIETFEGSDTFSGWSNVEGEKPTKEEYEHAVEDLMHHVHDQFLISADVIIEAEIELSQDQF